MDAFLLFQRQFVPGCMRAGIPSGVIGRLPAPAQVSSFVVFDAPARCARNFCADDDRLDWPWRPSETPRRPAAPGEVVVTSACDSVVAGGILGLGYALWPSEPGAQLHDPSGTIRNMTRASAGRAHLGRGARAQDPDAPQSAAR